MLGMVRIRLLAAPVSNHPNLLSLESSTAHSSYSNPDFPSVQNDFPPDIYNDIFFFLIPSTNDSEIFSFCLVEYLLISEEEQYLFRLSPQTKKRVAFMKLKTTDLGTGSYVR